MKEILLHFSAIADKVSSVPTKIANKKRPPRKNAKFWRKTACHDWHRSIQKYQIDRSSAFLINHFCHATRSPTDRHAHLPDGDTGLAPNPACRRPDHNPRRDNCDDWLSTRRPRLGPMPLPTRGPHRPDRQGLFQRPDRQQTRRPRGRHHRPRRCYCGGMSYGDDWGLVSRNLDHKPSDQQDGKDDTKQQHLNPDIDEVIDVSALRILRIITDRKDITD